MRALVILAVALVAVAVPARAQQRYEVTQRDKKFGPSKLTVQRGDTVVFTNNDPVVHNVFSETPGFEFNLKRQAPGASAATTFRREGVAEVRCAIHPSMKLTITVK
jgi:plastocyanin